MAAATVAVTINLSGGAGGIATLLESFRYSAFQVVSITTTTGYGSADFDAWPALSRFIILALMFAGGSAGSTTGSIKCIRLLIAFKARLQGDIQADTPPCGYTGEAFRQGRPS